MSKTITIADATSADLTQALANPVPPAPQPPPAGGPTAPFRCTAANPLQTIVEGPAGEPLLMLGYDTNTKSPWLYLRSYLQGDYKHGIYAGSFFQFQCLKDDGTFGGAVTINGGYVDGTPGKENGDIDFVMAVNGVSSTFTMAGYYTPPLPNTIQYPPGLTCWPPDLLSLGTATNRFKGAGLQILPVRPGMPTGATGCVDVGGGHYAPVYS